jgi:hypothetical protein
LVSEMWGKYAHVSKVVDKDSTPSKIRCLMRVAQVHCNYQCSTILEDVVNITDLNGQAVLHEVGMNTPLCFTLHQVLLCYVCLSNGHHLLAEIHQSNNVMGRVQAVIPNTPEAEQMILMMDNNFSAYIGNILRDQGLPNFFLMELFKCLCFPTMMSEMSSCTWDPDSSVLTTLRESADKQNLVDLERAAWYKNEFPIMPLKNLVRQSRAITKPRPLPP